MKKHPKAQTSGSFGVGALAYIPSQTRLIKYDPEKRDVVADHMTLIEPAVVPIVEARLQNSMVKVHYKGGLWWASGADLYEVSQDSLGGSLK